MNDQLDDQHIIPIDDQPSTYYQHHTIQHPAHYQHHRQHDITAPTTRINRQKQQFSCSALIWSFISWIIYITLIATFIAALLLTYQYHQNKCEHPLTVMTGIVGVAGLIWILVIPYQVQLEEHAPPSWESACFRLTWCLRLTCFLTLLTTTIIGSVWTFSMNPHTSICPHPLYVFSYYFLIGWWCMIGVGVVIVIILITVMCLAFMR